MQLEEAWRNVGHDENPLVALGVPELSLQPFELETIVRFEIKVDQNSYS